MSFGISVAGISGRLLIDKDYSNYTTAASGTVNLSVVGSSSICKGDVSLSGYTKPIIVFKPPLGKPVSYWGGRLYGHSSSSFGVQYRILVPVSSVPASTDTHGIRAFDSSGNTVFDSGHTVLNTLNSFYYSGTQTPTIEASIDDWIIATTWGIVVLGDTYANGNLSYGNAVYLEKLSNGNFSSSVRRVDISGPGTFRGQRVANNTILLNRCQIL